jgi:hypothetical protein
MKKTLLIFGAVALIVFAGSAVWAIPTINIYDLENGISYDYHDFTFGSVQIVQSAEWVYFFCYIAPSGSAPTGTWTARMMEREDATDVSDYATLVVYNNPGSPTVFVLNFYSDDYPDFSPPATSDFTITEDGTLQTLFNFSGLVINAQSDPYASEVPIPGAVWLLGSGLIGLAVARRKKRLG